MSFNSRKMLVYIRADFSAGYLSVKMHGPADLPADRELLEAGVELTGRFHLTVRGPHTQEKLQLACPVHNSSIGCGDGWAGCESPDRANRFDQG